MSDVFINAFWHIIERTIEGTCTVMLHMLKYIPGVQEVHDEAVGIGAYPLVYCADRFNTQRMGIKAAE